MTQALLPTLVGGIVSLSTKVAVDNAVKLGSPPHIGAVNGFLIKGVTFLVGGYIAHKFSQTAVKNAEAFASAMRGDTPVIEVAEKVD